MNRNYSQRTIDRIKRMEARPLVTCRRCDWFKNGRCHKAEVTGGYYPDPDEQHHCGGFEIFERR